MTNERRECPRLPVTIDAVLSCQTSTLVCTIRDISLNGAFIEAHPEEIPYNGAVELGVTVTANGENSYHRLPATITRVSDKGAGISFGDIGQETYFSLVDLVYADRTPSSSAPPGR